MEQFCAVVLLLFLAVAMFFPPGMMFSWPMFSRMSLAIPDIWITEPDGSRHYFNVYSILPPGKIAGEDSVHFIIEYLKGQDCKVTGSELVYDTTGSFTRVIG